VNLSQALKSAQRSLHQSFIKIFLPSSFFHTFCSFVLFVPFCALSQHTTSSQNIKLKHSFGTSSKKSIRRKAANKVEEMSRKEVGNGEGETCHRGQQRDAITAVPGKERHFGWPGNPLPPSSCEKLRHKKRRLTTPKGNSHPQLPILPSSFRSFLPSSLFTVNPLVPLAPPPTSPASALPPPLHPSSFGHREQLNLAKMPFPSPPASASPLPLHWPLNKKGMGKGFGLMQKWRRRSMGIEGKMEEGMLKKRRR
jgi:hypothetical protein